MSLQAGPQLETEHGTDLWTQQGKKREGGFREQSANTRITMWTETASGGLLGDVGDKLCSPTT